MPNYTDLPLQSLIDLLVKHTNEYTKMLAYSSYSVEEFAQCKQALAEIQQAIKSKSEQGGYTLKNIISDLPDYIITLPDNPAIIERKEQQSLQ